MMRYVPQVASCSDRQIPRRLDHQMKKFATILLALSFLSVCASADDHKKKDDHKKEDKKKPH